MSNFHRICLTVFFIGYSALTMAQAPAASHRISAHLKGLSNKTAYLANYFGPTQYIPRDTAQSDAEGRLLFDGANTLPEGLYMIVVDAKPVMQLVIGEQNFSFEADTADIVGTIKFAAPGESALFYDYQKFLQKQYKQITAIRNQNGANNQTQIAALQKESNTYRTDFIKKNPKSLTVKLLQAVAEPEVPPAPKLANGRPDSLFVFNYYKSHFFDGFDFSDERLLRSPFVQQKLDRYLKELTVQTVDSLIKEADYLVGRAKANKEMLSYTIWYITNQYEQSKVIGLDGVFVHMAEKYYLTGVMPLSDTASLSSIRKRAQILKPLLAGKIIPNMSAQDSLGRPQALHSVKGEYVVAFMYDPDCGHCKESAPKLKKFFEDHRAKGMQVYAVAINNTPEKWRQFVREQKLQGMVHVYGPSSGINFEQKYDVYSTPTVYFLDKNKKILARRLPVEELESYFQFMQRQQPAKPKAPTPTAKAGSAASTKK
ncbi:redoxin domain-containing protein [Tellurirhabdus bombi]|uniref:redoxin domain-containing protein n=1 Tax=Tellurirhabdus bombi TaxID=2907205 RepID=UPI001F2207CD|nr:redoxin domain-containing protein [Tellurirhabdus bombi]